MPVIQAFKNLDDYYTTIDRKIILNNIKLTQENLKELIYTTYDETISLIPQCECGEYKGGYLIGKVCNICGTEVNKPFENIKPILWVERFPDGPPFVNPAFWADLSKIISSKVDGLRWLSDTSYNPPNVPPVLANIKELIGGRSYGKLITNIEKVIIFLKHNSYYKTLSKQKKLKGIHEVYLENKDKLFSDHLPLINRKLFIMEKTNKGNYTTVLLADIIDLALLAINTANDVTMTPKRIENNTAKLIAKSASLFVNYVHDIGSGKRGIIRKNIYGTRAHFTFRCVVSALAPQYSYDEIHVPWTILTTTFRPHVYNKLIKRGYTPKVTSDKIFKAVTKYDPEIAEIGNEIIQESKYKGIPCLANRNPSLRMGSIQLVYITKFKPDPEEQTVSISVLIAPSFNMDYDGDELNFTPMLSDELSDMAHNFAPHRNLPAMDIYKISGNLNLPKTSAITLSSYISTKEKENEQCGVYKKLKMLNGE